MQAEEQFEAFSKFLDSRAMTIDIWNGDNFMHFGQVRVPLHFLMRQGSTRSVMGQEFDVVESESATVVARLQLILVNEARLVKELEKKPASQNRQASNLGAHNQKIETSYPYDTREI